MAVIKFEFQGQECQFDNDKITLQQAFAVKAHTGCGLVSWMEGCGDADPACLQAWWWIINAHSGRTLSMDECANFNPIALLEAIESGVDASGNPTQPEPVTAPQANTVPTPEPEQVGAGVLTDAPTPTSDG